MRDPERIDRILTELGTIWKKVPDQRFLQLISNLYKGAGDPFYVEDDLFEEWLKDNIFKIKL